MAFGPTIRVDGAQELSRAFRNAGRGKELTAAHRRVAKLVESRTRDGSASGTPQQAKAAKAWAARASAVGAQIGIRNSATVPFGIGAFMGSLAYRQFPAWVGDSWDLLAGSGPYVLRDVFGRNLDEIEDTYLREIAQSLAEAGFPMEIN